MKSKLFHQALCLVTLLSISNSSIWSMNNENNNNNVLRICNTDSILLGSHEIINNKNNNNFKFIEEEKKQNNLFNNNKYVSVVSKNGNKELETFIRSFYNLIERYKTIKNNFSKLYNVVTEKYDGEFQEKEKHNNICNSTCSKDVNNIKFKSIYERNQYSSKLINNLYNDLKKYTVHFNEIIDKFDEYKKLVKTATNKMKELNCKKERMLNDIIYFKENKNITHVLTKEMQKVQNEIKNLNEYINNIKSITENRNVKMTIKQEKQAILPMCECIKKLRKLNRKNELLNKK